MKVLLSFVAVVLLAAGCADPAPRGDSRAAATGSAPSGTLAQSTSRAKQAFGVALGALQNADAMSAISALNAVPGGEFAPVTATLRQCILQRLAPDPRAEGDQRQRALAQGVVDAYRAYWRRALREPARRGTLEQLLVQRLQALLGDDAAAATDLDSLEPLLAAQLEREGLHMLGGVTPPLHELMLWRSQEVREYDVALPEQVQQVRVFLIGDFVIEGWLDDASCGVQGTGGWSADNGIYALAAKYPDLQDESFRVSLLAHEAQHYADKSRPGWQLAGWELEYRAKLVEVALAQASSAALLEGFAAARGDDPAIPHPYANARVLAALRAQLHLADNADLAAVPPARLQAAARDALRADTRRLEMRSAVLPRSPPS